MNTIIGSLIIGVCVLAAIIIVTNKKTAGVSKYLGELFDGIITYAGYYFISAAIIRLGAWLVGLPFSYWEIIGVLLILRQLKALAQTPSDKHLKFRQRKEQEIEQAFEALKAVEWNIGAGTVIQKDGILHEKVRAAIAKEIKEDANGRS